MPHTLFISDLHLCASRPNINELFFDFLKNTASQAQALYILGDLFDYWIGDDDMDGGLNGAAVSALAALADGGTKIYFMHGNRDFLIGGKFASQARLTLLLDPTLVTLYDRPTLLMHGDTLCTDDVDYQRFRTQVREPKWQEKFLDKPLHERRAEVEMLRQRSEEAKQSKSIVIMDVTPDTVEKTLREHGYPQLIHGHTHRPAKHIHAMNDKTCERWVLPDWYTTGGYIYADRNGLEIVNFAPR